MRGKNTAVLLAFVLIFMLSSCGFENTEEKVENKEVVTLTIALRSGVSAALQDIKYEFERDNPEIKLKFIELSSGFEQYSFMKSSFFTEERLFDIAEIEDVWVDDFTEKKWILPVGIFDEYSGGYFDFVKDCFVRDSVGYAIPFEMNLGMYFSLKQSGWNGEYSEIAGGENGSSQSGLKIYDDKENAECSITELVNYTGGDVREALRLYREIYCFGEGERIDINEFKNGNIPIIHSWSRDIPTLYQDSSKVVASLKIHNTPIGNGNRETTVAKVFGLSISSLTPYREECEKLLRYFACDDTQIKFVLSSGTYPMKPEFYDNDTIAVTWGYIPAMKERVKNVNLRPHRRQYAESARKLNEEIFSFISQNKTEDAAAAAVEEFLNSGSENMQQ